MATLFTRIINGEIPGTFVWADEECVAFMTIEPVTPGHLLLVPRQEAESYWDASPEVVAHMARVAQILSRAQLEAFSTARVAQAVAGFDVPHLHIHLIPVDSEADMALSKAKAAEPSELEEAAAKIRAALSKAGYPQVCEAAPGA
ncbi:MAG: HIT family protein [Actinomycetaceae bacterium]|nr:HIT family protein [Actinomycetaceae bacterium]